MDITEKIERFGNNPLDKKKVLELVQESFENAAMNLEQLEIINVIPFDYKNKLRKMRTELNKMKIDILDDMEN